MDLKLKKIELDGGNFSGKLDSEIFSKVEMPFFRKCFYSSLNSDNILIYREKVSINENITRILENEFGKIIKVIR